MLTVFVLLSLLKSLFHCVTLSLCTLRSSGYGRWWRQEVVHRTEHAYREDAVHFENTKSKRSCENGRLQREND